MFEGLSEEVPEQSHIGSEVWDCESGEGVRSASGDSGASGAHMTP